MSRYVRELVFLVCSHRFVALVFGVEVGAVVAAEEATMNIPPRPGDLCAYFPAVFNSASQLSDELLQKLIIVCGSSLAKKKDTV